MALVQRDISREFIPFNKIAIKSADICSSATTPFVYASITQSICGSDSSRLSRLAPIISTASKASLILEDHLDQMPTVEELTLEPVHQES